MQLKRSLGLGVSKNTIWPEIEGQNSFRFRKWIPVSMMTNLCKTHRGQWAVERAHWTIKWLKVIFSDEKKFNLDGFNGTQ